MVEAMYSLSILEDEETVKEKLLKKFRQVAVDNADHVQPGFAAFFLSAFPNTTDYKIPQGVLQGTACFQCQHDCKHDSVIKLYY